MRTARATLTPTSTWLLCQDLLTDPYLFYLLLFTSLPRPTAVKTQSVSRTVHRLEHHEDPLSDLDQSILDRYLRHHVEDPQSLVSLPLRSDLIGMCFILHRNSEKSYNSFST